MENKDNSLLQRKVQSSTLSDRSNARASSGIQLKEEEEIESKASLSPPNYQFDSPPTEPPPTEGQVNNMAGDISGDQEILNIMGEKLNQDFSTVNLYKNSYHALKLNARAYTQGEDIYFAPGEFNPRTQDGQELIGHELQHVVQQREGKVKSNSTIQGYQLNDNQALEAEANSIGKQLANNSNISKKTKTKNKAKGSTIQRQAADPEYTETVPDEEFNDLERRVFDLQDVWGPRSLVPPLTGDVGDYGYGGFEATYIKSLNTINITVRGKTRLLDGLSLTDGTVTANEEGLGSLASILNKLDDYTLTSQVIEQYLWSEAEKVEALIQFKLRLSEAIGIWENTDLDFNIDKPGWEDITAKLKVHLDVSDEGSLGDTNSRKANREHQQISIYKCPKGGQQFRITELIDKAILKVEKEKNMSIDHPKSYDVRASVDGQDDGPNAADTIPHNGSMSLSSNDIEKTKYSASHLRHIVYFENNSTKINSTDKDSIKDFIKSYKKDSDNHLQNNAISLSGNTSAIGSKSHNRRIAQKRIDVIRAILEEFKVSNISTRLSEKNNGESVQTNKYPETIGQKDHKFRAVVIRIGTGKSQHTIAHEFGHVFGLADEYQEDDRKQGKKAGHHRLTKKMDAGDAIIEDNDGIISVGNQVRPQHYSVFTWALRELTGKPWKVRNNSKI